MAGLRKAEAPLRSAIASAKLIVTGVVQEVRPLAGAKAKYLGSVDNGWQVCSEHRPRWKEAVVRVTSVEKGSSGDLVIIIFPSVRDCFWNESPKFIVGQIGTWLLHKDQLGEAGAAVLLKSEKLLDREIQSYTALAPADFQPTDPDGKTAKRITELIKTKTP